MKSAQRAKKVNKEPSEYALSNLKAQEAYASWKAREARKARRRSETAERARVEPSKFKFPEPPFEGWLREEHSQRSVGSTTYRFPPTCCTDGPVRGWRYAPGHGSAFSLPIAPIPFTVSSTSRLCIEGMPSQMV